MAAWNVIFCSAAEMPAVRYGLIQLFVGMGHAPFVDLPMLAWNSSIAAEL